MNSSSPWPVRIGLASVTALILGGSLIPELPTLAGQDMAPTLAAQDDDRGSGRLRPRTQNHKVSFRGSGRINPDPARPNPPQNQAIFTTYRGSGRINPLNPARA